MSERDSISTRWRPGMSEAQNILSRRVVTDKSSLKGPFKLYVTVASELSVANDLLLRGSRLVIPPKLRTDILTKIHTGHQGITKCWRCVAQSVRWPGITKDLEGLISKCPVGCRQRLKHSELLLTSPLPDYPWQKAATDLFQWRNSTLYWTSIHYLIWSYQASEVIFLPTWSTPNRCV